MNFFVRIFLYFFIIGLPCIIHYATITSLDPAFRHYNQSSFWAFFYLAVSLILWLGVFVYHGYFDVIRFLITRKDANDRAVDSQIITAKIISSEVLKSSDKMAAMSLDLAFTNLGGAKVVLNEFRTFDSKPNEKRFEAGNTIRMRLSRKGNTYTFLPDAAKVEVGGALVWNVVFLLLYFCFAVALFLYCYSTESLGNGWRFLSPMHVLFVIPASDLFFHTLFLWFGKMMTSDEGNKLLYIGKPATAKVLRAQQTGMMINEQPQIKFDLEFRDHRGVSQKVSTKKIVNLLELHTVSDTDKKILYDPENPKDIMFLPN